MIVVDDGSTDGTCEMVEAREGVTFVRQANAGPGAARNRGAEVATGTYLAFLDSDDLWFPWSLEAMAKLISEHDRPALLFARFEDFTRDDPPAAVEASAEGQAYADFLSSAGDGCFAGAGMMVVEREAFLAAGGFAEDRLNAEDHDFALRLGTAPGFVQVTAPVIVAHRMHEGNEMGDMTKSLDGMARLVAREHGGVYPGGDARAVERRQIIARHVRPAVLNGLKAGQVTRALRLYRRTFTWNLRMGRWAFLLAAPALALRGLLLPQPAERDG